MDIRSESDGETEWNGDGKEHAEDEFYYVIPQC